MSAIQSSFDRRPIEVWLIDDNDLYVSVVTEAINLSDDVRCTASFGRCEPALEQLANHAVPPHVILLDIGLPGISGLQAIQKFKDLSPRMQIIMLTVFDLDDKVTSALMRGASGYLLKTSTTEDILRGIRATMQGGMPLDPMVTRELFRKIKESKRPSKDYFLTDREKDVLKLMVDGLFLQEMGEKLFISTHTVTSHMKHIYEKLGVTTRSMAVAKAITENLI